MKSTDDLPVVGEEQVEDFKIQAQEEVKYTLDEADQEEEMEELKTVWGVGYKFEVK